MITFENVTVRLGERLVLPDTSFTMRKGQSWVVLGENGAGKTTLAKTILGRLPVVKGRLIRHDPEMVPERIGHVSFDLQRDLVSREESADHARTFAHRRSSSARVADILFPSPKRSPWDAEEEKGNISKTIDGTCFNLDKLLEFLNPAGLLEKAIRHLSNGEMRRVLITRALMKKPRLLILDEPFDGLDVIAQGELFEWLERFISSGLHILLITHRVRQIPKFISRAILLENCRVVARGDSDSLINRYRSAEPIPDREEKKAFAERSKKKKDCREIIIRMKKVRVAYGETTVFEKLDWTVKSEENWAILGPNGAGKSSLLGLVSADNLQAYANDITLFGKKRGSGESIWEIKEKLGFVSPEFQIRYRKPVSSFEVVVSGFYDSVGLYRRHGEKQANRARQWIEKLKLGHLASIPFNRLSHGEQRMILVARALVKSPRMLVLDEPCQGLDPKNRALVLSMIDRIGENGMAQILFVTHYPDEIPDCITHVLNFEPSKNGGCRATPMPISQYLSGHK